MTAFRQGPIVLRAGAAAGPQHEPQSVGHGRIVLRGRGPVGAQPVSTTSPAPDHGPVGHGAVRLGRRPDEALLGMVASATDAARHDILRTVAESAA
jgi:hypothetical protein